MSFADLNQIFSFVCVNSVKKKIFFQASEILLQLFFVLTLKYNFFVQKTFLFDHSKRSFSCFASCFAGRRSNKHEKVTLDAREFYAV